MVRVTTAAEMAAAVTAHAHHATIVLMAAAVADHRPRTVAPSKLRKAALPVTLELEPTVDILRSLGENKGERFLAGFAAETDDLLASAERKLGEKHLDLIVANDVSGTAGGFESEQNAATLLDAQGGQVEVPLVSKRELAERILDRVRTLRPARAGRV